jgi:hypothetical protein
MSFKRQADTELNQDNVHEMDKEVSDKAKHDTWKKAPDDVLATRKYVALYLLYSPENILTRSLSGRGLAMLVGKQNSKVVASGVFGGTDFDSRVLL